MRRSEREVADKAIIEKILCQASICRLGFAFDNVPYIVPVNYGYRENKIYIHSAPKGEKIDLIKKCKTVCFEIELASEVLKDKLACNWTSRYRSIIGYGTIKIITDKAEKTRGMDIIMAQHGGPEKNEYNASFERMVILELEIERLTAKQAGEWK
jgi:nitroimidazol reductase NimA-like FMN-containing flavoprotein (pyridoxamine 5'-phosphate oxidase superfamily)